MKILSLICHNGLGHYKRSIEVLNELVAAHPDVFISVACEPWQIRRMEDWDVSRNFWNSGRVEALHNIMAPGVFWSQDPTTYENGSLAYWHQQLKWVPQLHEADLVISDNLPQVLHYRPGALLMGSFLWSDILEAAYPQSSVVSAFVMEERSLLEQYRPPMICLDDMAMEGVVNRTNAVRMPWFCVRQPEHNMADAKIPHIALLGGATGTLATVLSELAIMLAQTRRAQVFVPAAEAATHPLLHPFSFGDEDFRVLDAIICRPGIGTLTDGVRYGVPVIALSERDNLEMAHNGNRVSALGIGIDLGAETAVPQMGAHILEFLHSEACSKAKASIRQRPDNGVQRTVDWILNNYQ